MASSVPSLWRHVPDSDPLTTRVRPNRALTDRCPTAGRGERDPLGDPRALDGEGAVAARHDEVRPVPLTIAARCADDGVEAAEGALAAREVAVAASARTVTTTRRNGLDSRA